MSASTSDLNTTTSQSEQNAGVYLLNNAFSTSPPTATTTAMLMQKLQQSVPSTCHSMLMNEFLLKHATAALAAQHIEPMNSFQQSQIEDFPIENSQLSSIKIEDDQKSKTTTNICAVCLDEASGKHYGSVTCFGCKGFFRRTVRSNKVYTCRYDQSCQIDKVGRNVCRSCRFRKCLQVGMVPDAIRPDRDKTGRQRNPRRSVNSMSSSKSHGDVDMDDRTSRASPSLDVQCASTASSPSENDFNLQSCCESAAPSVAAVQQKNLIVETLSQIEHICAEFLVDDQISSNCVESEERLQFLTDVIARTSLIARRTPLDYSGRLPLKDPNCYATALRRLVVQAIDYANTLKPIADMDKNEKIVLIRSFIASFILLTTVHKSVNEGQTDRILLPNGYYVDATTPLSAFREESEDQAKSREQTWIESRINFTRSNIIEKLNTTVDKLNLTDEEFICLKAILVLDPNVTQLSEQSAQKLNLARDHVQNALYVHLTEQYGDQEAITRFGNLLMLLGNITKTGVHFGNIIQMSRELQPNADSMILELFSI